MMALTKVSQSLMQGRTVSVLDYGADPTGLTDSTAAFNAAIAAASQTLPSTIDAGVTLICNGGVFVIGALNTITVPIIIDFQNGYVIPNTTGVMFTIGYSNATYNAEKFVMRDVTFIGSAAWTQQPSDLIKIGTTVQSNQVVLQNVNAWGVTTTHSLIWNYRSFGLTMRDCILRGCSSPQAIYLSKSLVDDSTFSNAINLDHIEISAHTGLGIYSQGADMSISNKSVIEACTLGGIKTINNTNKFIVTDCYFEANYQFDISITEQLYGGNYTVRGCFFGGAPNVTTSNRVYIDNSALLSGSVDVTVQDNYFYFGGVIGPVGSSPNYIGINNQTGVFLDSWIGEDRFNYELSNLITPTFNANIINSYGVNGTSPKLTYTTVYSDTEWTGATGSTPPTNWSVLNAGTFTIVNAGAAPYDVALQIAHSGAVNNPAIYRQYTTVAGKKYRFSFAIKSATATPFVFLGKTIGANQYTSQSSTTGAIVSFANEFIAETTTTFVTLQAGTIVAGQSCIFDQVILEELGATITVTGATA
jgi:hypothetical protein